MYIEWEKLPRKTISSGGLFFNDNGEVLIVKPNYKDGWIIPGGMIETGESPVEAYMREVSEEIGLNKNPLGLVCIDYTKKTRGGHDHLNFVFDGGILTSDEIGKIKLQTDELTEYRFILPREAVKIMTGGPAKRLLKCIEGRDGHKIIYLENGDFIGNDTVADFD